MADSQSVMVFEPPLQPMTRCFPFLLLIWKHLVSKVGWHSWWEDGFAICIAVNLLVQSLYCWEIVSMKMCLLSRCMTIICFTIPISCHVTYIYMVLWAEEQVWIGCLDLFASVVITINYNHNKSVNISNSVTLRQI